jgi:hypothetical protein
MLEIDCCTFLHLPTPVISHFHHRCSRVFSWKDAGSPSADVDCVHGHRRPFRLLVADNGWQEEHCLRGR